MKKKPTYEELENEIRRLTSELAEMKREDQCVIKALSEDFQNLADRSQDAIYRFDIESQTFTFFNRRFLDLFVIENEGARYLSLQSVMSRVHSEDREQFEKDMNRSLRFESHGGENEYRIIDPDGAILWMHDKWTVLRDASGRAVAVEGFIRNNTRQRQVENMLEKSRKNALIGTYIVRNAKFIYVNPEFCRIIGYSKKELIGTHPLVYVHDDYKAYAKENAVRMLKRERTKPYEYCIVDKSGVVKWIMETVTSIPYERDRGVLGFFMDISGAKQAETEKREREKLQAILELAGAVGHELNNPLQVLVVCRQQIEHMLRKNRSVDSQLALMKKNIQRLINIGKKFQSITSYQTKDYVQGKKILDIDAASGNDEKTS